jgi:NTE family protein
MSGPAPKPGGNGGAPPARPDGVKHINVALQGGGSHGAYSWGVLDRLLADDRIKIEAISGTSAGAMNGVLVAEGLAEGGRERARAQLASFWKSISDEAAGSPLQRNMWDKWFSNWSLDHNPAFAAYDLMTRMVSPYQFNPLNLNALRDLIAREIDFGRVHACNSMKLFISATNVETGRVKVFTGRDVTIDAIMASACLPYVFQAVEIGGAPYWDGGYLGNPALYPFIGSSDSADVLLVQINPLYREGTPRTAVAIQDRLNEITFNASLLHELSHIEFINSHIRSGELKGCGYREMFLHRIGGGAEIAGLTASSKMNAEWAFLRHLHDLGFAAAETWLGKHFDEIGQMGTMDLNQFGLRPGASHIPVTAEPQR